MSASYAGIPVAESLKNASDITLPSRFSAAAEKQNIIEKVITRFLRHVIPTDRINKTSSRSPGRKTIQSGWNGGSSRR